MRIAIAVFMLLVSSFSNFAQAGVTSGLSGPGSILDGSTASFTAYLNETGAPAGYDWENIFSVSYTFNSGDGQTHTGSMAGLSTNSLAISDAFTYETTGSYTPSFSANVTTSDGYHYWLDTSYYQNSGHYESYAYSCGWWSTCYASYWVDTSHWVYQGHDQYAQTTMNYNTNSWTSLEVLPNSVGPVPEPETYAMLLAGLGLLGFMARRRKQQAA